MKGKSGASADLSLVEIVICSGSSVSTAAVTLHLTYRKIVHFIETSKTTRCNHTYQIFISI